MGHSAMTWLLMLTVCFVACASSDETCTTHAKQNNNGVNLESTASTTLSYGECCDKCGGTIGCVGYTWVQGSGECWLKSSIDVLTSDAAVVSGSVTTNATCVTYEKQNNHGVNLERAATITASYGSCCEKCSKTAACVGYTWVQQSGECWLKSSLAALVADAAVVSGSVASPAPPPAPPVPPAPAPTGRYPLAPAVTSPDAVDPGWAGGSHGGPVGGEKSARLLGKTLRFRVDVKEIGCGCVTGFYLVQHGSGQCDASGNRGTRCGEIDIMEGNRFSFHSTLHNALDHPGLFGGFGGVQQPDMMYGQGPRDMTGEQYGPGGSIIDTSEAFNVAVSFPKHANGSLVDMVVMLFQDGQEQMIEWRVNKHRSDASRSPALTCDDSSCNDCFSKPGCIYGDADLEAFGAWLDDGMTPLATYWDGKPAQQTWLDGVLPGETGGCQLDNQGRPGTESYGSYAGSWGCGGAFGIGSWTIEAIQGALPSDWAAYFQLMDASPVVPQRTMMTKAAVVPFCPGGSQDACKERCLSDAVSDLKFRTCRSDCEERCSTGPSVV